MRYEILRSSVQLVAPTVLFTNGERFQRRAFRFGLHIMQALGLFWLARYITRRGLRIICYHGFAVANEYKYRSTLFIEGSFFRKRLEYLHRHGYPILRLGEALEALDKGQLPPCATVITMDDGWSGVHTVGLPIITEFQIPVTVYVTTYYVENPMPVFTVTLSYLFWRTAEIEVRLPRELGIFDLSSHAEEAEKVAQRYGGSLPPVDRLEFLREMATALDVSFTEIETQRLFRVMDRQQLHDLANADVDIQLHSHRHEWPLYDKEMVVSEIHENQGLLSQIVSQRFEHFCYPSGVYGPHQAEWLAELGLKSATTIEPGLNYSDTPRFALRRLVDGGRVSDIEFAAEMTGFMEIIRHLRSRRFFLDIMAQVRWRRASRKMRNRSSAGQ